MRPDTEMIDLSCYGIVFCDSGEALRKLSSQGLNPAAHVRTVSPNLLHYGVDNFNIEAMEAPIAGERYRTFKKAIRGFGEEIHDLCQEHDEIRGYATTIARQAVAFQNVTLNAACLSNADFHEPRLVVQLQTGDALIDRFLNGPWGSLLSGNREAKTVIVDIEPSGSLDLIDPRRLRRWMHQGFEYLGYRAGLLLSAWAPWLFRQGKVALVLKENELLFETAYHLARNGIRLESITNKPIKTLAEDIIPADCEAQLGAAIQRFVSRFVCEAAVGPCLREALEQIRDAVGRHAAAQAYWRRGLSESKRGETDTVLLTNYPCRPEDGGLFEVCNQYRVPMIAFQHGISREINAVHGDIGMENSNAHLTLVYNEAARKRSDQTPFHHWPTFAVGYPTIGRRISHLMAYAFEKTQPVFFVSTAVSRGYRHMVTTSLTDSDMCRMEIGIIENVLARVPHRVTYKPYPYLNRYADPDPILRVAKETQNISVVTDNVDMRYLIGSAKVIVTSRATSTTGWCLMSHKPLCFINVPDQMPLREEVKAAFEEALFLFDTSDPNFHQSLLDFLSRPLDEIEDLWNKKAKARERMLQRFVDLPVRSTGKRAAGYILDHCFEPEFFETHRRRKPQRARSFTKSRSSSIAE